MATSSITKNFVVEGKDADDFINSLDDAFLEREKRLKTFKRATRVTDEMEIKNLLEGKFANV